MPRGLPRPQATQRGNARHPLEKSLWQRHSCEHRHSNLHFSQGIPQSSTNALSQCHSRGSCSAGVLPRCFRCVGSSRNRQQRCWRYKEPGVTLRAAISAILVMGSAALAADWEDCGLEVREAAGAHGARLELRAKRDRVLTSEARSLCGSFAVKNDALGIWI